MALIDPLTAIPSRPNAQLLQALQQRRVASAVFSAAQLASPLSPQRESPLLLQPARLTVPPLEMMPSRSLAATLLSGISGSRQPGRQWTWESMMTPAAPRQLLNQASVAQAYRAELNAPRNPSATDTGSAHRWEWLA